MEAVRVEASWDEDWPVNWEFIGMVLFPDEITSPPEFILINGVQYEKK